MTHSPRRIRLHPSYPAACYHIVNAERRREAPTNKKEDTALDRADPLHSPGWKRAGERSWSVTGQSQQFPEPQNQE